MIPALIAVCDVLINMLEAGYLGMAVHLYVSVYKLVLSITIC